MWSDSETSTDFLGFDLLIDTVKILVSDPSLRPVTIGINGTWGSGKSSLMEMVSAAVEDSEDETLKTITFSPWVYEDYEDIKYALIDAILDAVAEYSTDEDAADRAGRARAIARRLVTYRSAVTRIVGLGAGAGAAAVGVPEAGVPAAATAAALADGALDQIAEEPVSEAENGATTVAGLRDLLADLLSDLPDDLQLVVFVDDVDRCLPDTVVRTFEVMRLFCDIPEVTFVLAADRGIVEEAISARYRTLGFVNEDRAIGHDYLEKMWNVTVKIPPLSGPEVESYLTLLSCQRHHPEAVKALAGKARERRKGFDTLRPEDIAEVISEPSVEFQNDWTWITASADIIAAMDETHPGNPRQIKRFANRLSLGTQLLKKNGVTDVDPGVLVKLMLLEEQDSAGFNTLMQNAIGAPDGAPDILRRWERPDEKDNDSDAEEDTGHGDQGDAAAADAADLEKQSPFFREWLTLDPPLAEIDLRPYLYVARDQSPLARDARNLSANAEEVMHGLAARAGTPVLAEAMDGFNALDSGDRALIVSLLKRAVARQPAAKTTNAMLALARSHNTYVTPTIEALRSVRSASVTPGLVAKVAASLEDHPSSLRPLLEHWAETAHTGLARNAAAERAKSLDGG